VRYLGGKTSIAPKVAALVNAVRGDRAVWEPFCGGLSVSVQLAKVGPVLVSDANVALVSLYQAVRDGWDPPETLSEAEYAAAKALPPSNPLRAFALIGCSFGGHGGYARGGGRNYAAETRRGLLRDVGALKAAGCAIEAIDFLGVEPTERPLVIYADPPYAGTTGYPMVGPFDHARFWSRVQAWERCGVPVLVSEYSCPVPHTVVAEWAKRVTVNGSREAIERVYRARP